MRALDADNVPTTASMSEEEINALPVHKYKVSGSQSQRYILLVYLLSSYDLRMLVLLMFIGKVDPPLMFCMFVVLDNLALLAVLAP